MDDSKPKSARATRARGVSIDNSFEDPPASEKKNVRSKKLKDIGENESVSRGNNVDDLDDSASSKSSSSVRSCKVVLRRENFDEMKNDDRAIAHTTRGRRNSTLTEENVAAHTNPSRRSLRSASMASEGTEGTESTISRTRSTRLAASQNTPKKEISAARPMTPSRRSSRLLSENEKVADSPAKPTPAKRSLRSNSVVSVDDISPPTSRIRGSSRLAESQTATPKSLKTKVSKIKAEPITPRRASARINKSAILSEIIDEESTDDDETLANKSSNLKKVANVQDSIEEVKMETVKEVQNEDDVSKNVVQEEKTVADESAVVSSTVNDEKSETKNNEVIIVADEEVETVTNTVASISEVAKSPRVDTTRVVDSAEILIATSTAKTPTANTPGRQKADTPTVEPAEPMETSMTEHVENLDTPKAKARSMNISESSKTPQAKSPKMNISSVMDSEAATEIINETILSPSPSKSKSKQNTPVAKKVQHEMDEDASNGAKLSSSANASILELGTSNDFEQMDVEITSPSKSAKKDETLKEVLKETTPKATSRASNQFNSMDVTALTHEEEESVPTPKPPKKSSKRMSLNDTVQSTGFDRMEVSVLAAESEVEEREIEEVNTTTPRAKDVDQVKSPMSTAKTPVKTPIKDDKVLSSNRSNQNTPNKNAKIATPKSVTPKTKQSPKKTPLGEKTLCLDAEINKIIAGLETPIVRKNMESDFNAIATKLSPNEDSIIDREIDNISSDEAPLKPQPAEQAIGDNQIQEGNNVKPDEAIENSTMIDVHEVSVIDTSQPSVIEATQLSKITPVEPALQDEKMVMPTTGKKSVQIMTPIGGGKNHLSEKRIDTPYPAASVLGAISNLSGCDEAQKKRDELRANSRETLEKLKNSWTKSIKRNSLSSDSPKSIDKFGIESNDKVEDSPVKKSVPVRNNWNVAKGLIDSDSESEEEKVVSESEQEEDSDEECEEESENSFLDDGAEVIDDYNSGDSMDEDERREAEENDIEGEGEDLGSDDSEDDDDEEDYDYDDGFIVAEDEAIDEPHIDEDEEIIGSMPKRSASKQKRSRIIPESSSDESEDESINENSNSSGIQVISIPMEQVESIVVIEGNPAAEAIVEGKTFATTYLTPGNEEIKERTSVKKVDSVESSPKIVKSKPIESKSILEKQDEEETTGNEEEKTTANVAQAKSNVNESDESIDTGHEEPEKVTTTDASVEESTAPTTDSIKIDENNSNVSKLQSKQSKFDNEKVVAKKQRTSLPGIDRLAKVASSKKASRMSLGDLNPKQPVGLANVGLVETPKNIPKTNSKQSSSVKKMTNQSVTQPQADDDDETRNDMNTSSSFIENLSPNRKNGALDISSQEENNNQKPSVKKDNAVETFQNDEIIPIEADGITAEPSIHGQDAADKINDGESKSKKKTKSKRKFEEIDVGEELVERPRSKKLLKVISTASGVFIEEPMTPEKQNKHGFQVTPLTPINPNFRVEKLPTANDRATSNKRKSIYLDEEEASELLLPKPRWALNTQFEYGQPRKRARKLELGSTEIIMKPLEPTRKVRAFVPAELLEFRHKRMYRAGIPRQDARAILREKYKKRANYK